MTIVWEKYSLPSRTHLKSLSLKSPECLALGLFTLKLLLYSDAHDSHQERVKNQSWLELVELVADLQVPLGKSKIISVLD